MGIERKRFEGDRRRTAQVLIAGENGEVEVVDLAIWHRPLTPAVQERLDEIRTEILADEIIEEGGEPAPRKRKPVLVAQLAYVLTRWDITEDGEPIVPTAEALESFEFEFLSAIQDAIFEPLYPKSTT